MLVSRQEDDFQIIIALARREYSAKQSDQCRTRGRRTKLTKD
jgi:hypothetical protein